MGIYPVAMMQMPFPTQHLLHPALFTAPLVPCFILECADVKYHGCAGPPQPIAEAMLVIVSGALASSYNDSLPTHLVTRRTACSTSQRALRNTRKTHLRLKCFASTDADNSLAQPTRALVRMALVQTVHLQSLVYGIEC